MAKHHDFKYMGDIRQNLWMIVFGTDTRLGKKFDVILLWVILSSIVVVMLESVAELNDSYGDVFTLLEWLFTSFFTAEYLMRLWIVRRPIKYATSFLGIIDFLAVIPTYLTIFFAGGSYLVVIRVIRFFRVFRILKLSRQLKEAQHLAEALANSRNKIGVFLGAVTVLVIIMGTLMYMIEGGENGFTSIPRSIYWAIVTITTVGYGDIAPQTIMGQAFAAALMLMGYAIIAVPTGIVTAEIAYSERERRAKKVNELKCGNCGSTDHRDDANYCQNCGDELMNIPGKRIV